jgi:F-type H+-transporting ATPase subunit b
MELELLPNSSIIVQFLLLVALLLVLRQLVFKPVLKILAKRDLAVRSLSEKASGDRQSIEEMGKTYEDTLKEKRAPILDARESILSQAHTTSMRVIEEARRDLTEELAKVKDTVGQEAAKTLEMLVARSETIAGEIVNKIVKRSV